MRLPPEFDDEEEGMGLIWAIVMAAAVWLVIGSLAHLIFR